MANERMRKVNELIHHRVAEIIQREIELPLDVFITLTHVDTSRDLAHTTIYLTVLPNAKRVSTIRLIESRRGLVRKILGQGIRMKITPQLHFKFDEQEIKAQRIYDAIDEQKTFPENRLDSEK